MKSKDLYYGGYATKYRYGNNRGIPFADAPVLIAGHRVTDRLIGGTVVQGDKHTPNNFSYETLYINYLKGYSSELSKYTSNIYTYTDCDGYIGAYDYRSENKMFDDLVFPDEVYNQALGRLNDQTRGTLDLSVDLLQAGQNIDMLNIVKRIRNYTFSSGWRNLVKGAASARLEYEYGWKPLASSLYGSLDESIHSCINNIERFKGRASKPINNRAINMAMIIGQGLPGVVTRHGRYLCEISVRLKTKNNDPARWASLNPISWAYELTPYSFVLDWMIDVGGYLRNLETSLLYANSFESGYVTRVVACDASFSGSLVKYVPGYPSQLTIADGSAGGRFIKFTRSVLSSYPVPRLPTFKVDLGSTRLLNLAAMLAQKLK